MKDLGKLINDVVVLKIDGSGDFIKFFLFNIEMNRMIVYSKEKEKFGQGNPDQNDYHILTDQETLSFISEHMDLHMSEKARSLLLKLRREITLGRLL